MIHFVLSAEEPPWSTVAILGVAVPAVLTVVTALVGYFATRLARSGERLATEEYTLRKSSDKEDQSEAAELDRKRRRSMWLTTSLTLITISGALLVAATILPAIQSARDKSIIAIESTFS